jgi:hypothetical protein
MDQFGRKIGKPLDLPFSGPKLDGHILTFHVTQFVEPLPECIKKMSTGRQGARPENSYAGQFRLLRGRRERPHDRGAPQKRDELAPPHIGSQVPARIVCSGTGTLTGLKTMDSAGGKSKGQLAAAFRIFVGMLRAKKPGCATAEIVVVFCGP